MRSVLLCVRLKTAPRSAAGAMVDGGRGVGGHCRAAPAGAPHSWVYLQRKLARMALFAAKNRQSADRPVPSGFCANGLLRTGISEPPYETYPRHSHWRRGPQQHSFQVAVLALQWILLASRLAPVHLLPNLNLSSQRSVLPVPLRRDC